MKKRAVEAVLILAALIGVFVLVNLLQSGISGAVRQIDGQYYIGSLCLSCHTAIHFFYRDR